MPDGPHVVVVLNYRGREDTLACVESLLRDGSATVLVVDNGSADGVIADVTDRWPQVQTLAKATNTGFSGGMNAGLREAMTGGAEVVTILNNDTVVPVGVMERLAEVARAGHAVSPEVRYLDRPGEVWFAGGVIDGDTGLARHLGHDELAATAVDDDGLRATDTLAGCCLTASAQTWQTVGLLDERYFLNFEDSDWSLRARAAGVALVVDTRSVIEHRVSASFTGAYSYLGLFYYTRNGLLFLRERVQASTRRRVLYLRRHVLPAITGDLRRSRPRRAARHALVVTVALAAHATSRYGAAPAWLTRRAARWAR